jgi:DNA-binding IclR family transcriptional regulator
MARTGKPALRRVAAVERSLRILEALADAGGELGTNELARRTRVNPSSVSRLLATLAAGGYVDHDADTGRYRLGIRLLQLGNVVLAGLDLRELARPHLEALVKATGETATLSVPGEQDAVTVDFVQSVSSVQSVARLGRPSVAHATAAGKVLLAFGEVQLPSGRLERFTPRTITDQRKLATEVACVREQGWAEAAGERERDLNAIAAPVFGADGQLAGVLGLQGPDGRFDRDARQRAVETLVAHTQTLSQALGSGA